MREKLAGFAIRAKNISKRLLQTDARGEPELYRRLQQEFGRANELAQLYEQWRSLHRARDKAKSWLNDKSAEIRQLSAGELTEIDKKLESSESSIRHLLVPPEANEGRNIYLEIRAGSGGGEAAIFCGDLYRMYKRYAENHKWQMEIISCSAAEQGGYREIVSRIEGREAWTKLRFESGVHRVQRVPITESQGRIHTSAASVAVLAEPDSINCLEIRPEELRIDTFRASGAGGQHVNKTDSAVRITHLPTHTVVECQSERSQHKNRASAMKLLHARLLRNRQQEALDSQSRLRRSIIGTGDRSERIRTYNFPQGRISDHRIDLTVHKLEEVLDGDLEPLVGAAYRQWQIEQIDLVLSGDDD